MIIYRIILTWFFLVTSIAFADSSESKSFLAITDIHFNPFLTCNQVSPCPLIETLRQAPSRQWSQILKTNDVAPPQFLEDTNYPLFTSALHETAEIVENRKPQFIVVLGDFLGHDYKDNFNQYASDTSQAAYQSFVKKTMEFMIGEIHQAFPKSNVYMTIGNNDSYQDDYFSDPNGAFFHDMTPLWMSVVNDKDNQKYIQTSFPKGGYYSVKIDCKINLIVLNSSLFSNKAQGNHIDAAANDELNWLHQTLKSAKEKHETVLIATHIPVGVDVFASLRKNPFSIVELWKPAYSSRFLTEISQYSDNIIAILAAHFHSDRFQLIGTGEHHQIPVSGTPGISPLFGNNPGFKLFSYTTDQPSIINFNSYFYALNGDQAWHTEYNFKRIYLENCPTCNFSKAMETLMQTGDESVSYIQYYTVGTMGAINVSWLPYYWCDIHNLTAGDYQSCIM